MKLIVAKRAGFCYGVKRAMSIVDRIVKEHEKENLPIYTLGDIIHNPQVVNRLKEEGVVAIEEMKKYNPGYLIIRSHGVSPDVIEIAEELGYKTIDATCPFVKKVHRYAQNASNEGRFVVVVGEHNHPEIKGIMGYIGGPFLIIENEEDMENLPDDKDIKITIVSQTTQSSQFFYRVVNYIKNMYNDIEYYDTICDATYMRQEESVEIAQTVDLMIVIGGYKSANTNRLALLCGQVGTKTYHIETAEELKNEWFENIEKIGITAGASTPNWIIDEVILKIKEINNIP